MQFDVHIHKGCTLYSRGEHGGCNVYCTEREGEMKSIIRDCADSGADHLGSEPACLHLSGSDPPPSTPTERSICKCFAAVALPQSDTFGTKYELSTKYEVSTPEL